ncbi:unnamed protein product [Victoria cruziana]
MKKAFDQTVRDLKREVNKKVLKVPLIEQKVLDATSNEPWGPHGSHLADIAQATRNFHEYQMIMSVLWKRVNDTGKNWRHVYKALTVLEYLVAHGSERVIDEIKEHAYQISTLSDFQYIDSSGRDQGSNVRKKSQSLVTLVNDKERIQEVRQKAHANRDKFRTGGMHKSSSYSGAVGGYGDRYDDDRSEGHHGSRDDERGGYGRERDWRDEDRYKKGLDSYSRDGDPYGRSEERYNRDGYRDDDYRSKDNEDNQFGPRDRSFDSERNRPGDEDDRYSSRSGGRGDEYYQDERRLERKLSSQRSAPPTYEEAVAEAQRHNNEESDGGSVRGSVHKASTHLGSADQSQGTAPAPITNAPVSKEVSDFDEFDPRGSVAAGPTSTASAENDILGSLMGPSSPSALAIVPVPAITTTSGSDVFADPGFGSTFVAAPPAASALGQVCLTALLSFG